MNYSPTPPFFDVELADPGIDYDQAMARGIDLWHFTVRAGVALGDNLAAQQNLDKYCASSGGSSVKAALEADLTLGGVVKALHVTQVSGTGVVPVRAHPNNFYLGAEWTVEIYATG